MEISSTDSTRVICQSWAIDTLGDLLALVFRSNAEFLKSGWAAERCDERFDRLDGLPRVATLEPAGNLIDDVVDVLDTSVINDILIRGVAIEV